MFFRSTGRRSSITSNLWSKLWRIDQNCSEKQWEDSSSCQEFHIMRRTSRCVFCFFLLLFPQMLIFNCFPQVLIRVARAEAVAARYSTMLICVLRTEEDFSCYDDAISSLGADKESVVVFGPWKAAPSVCDLLDCIQTDIRHHGYHVSIQRHATDKNFLFRTYDCFYKLTFTWWWHWTPCHPIKCTNHNMCLNSFHKQKDRTQIQHLNRTI